MRALQQGLPLDFHVLTKRNSTNCRNNANTLLSGPIKDNIQIDLCFCSTVEFRLFSCFRFYPECKFVSDSSASYDLSLYFELTIILV